MPADQISPYDLITHGRAAKPKRHAASPDACSRGVPQKSRAPSDELRPMAWRINDAARLLSVSRATIYLLARAGKLKLIRVAGRTLIPDSEVLRLANEGT
jgi:excisionase family DNA binding protein